MSTWITIQSDSDWIEIKLTFMVGNISGGEAYLAQPLPSAPLPRSCSGGRGVSHKVVPRTLPEAILWEGGVHVRGAPARTGNSPVKF